MDAFASEPDIVLPRKQINCSDDELIRRNGFQAHVRQFRKLTGAVISRRHELIDLFFHYNRGAAFAGFKSMPHRHPDYPGFASRRDIQFITLYRRDLASTVSSFMLALQKGTWRRSGGNTGATWRFDHTNKRPALAILRNLRANQRKLKMIEQPIDLVFEDLCKPGFDDPRLNEFFGRKIAIADPRAPLTGEHYTENWSEFLAFVEESL